MKVRYAIHCTPGGLLREETIGQTIYFDTYVEAETEAQRLTKAGDGIVFTPVEVPDDRH